MIQATKERSHYYVGSVLKRVKQTIEAQDMMLQLQEAKLKKWTDRRPRTTGVRKVYAPEAKRIIDDYEAGHSWEYLVTEHRRDRATIRRVLKRAGVTMRMSNYIPRFDKKKDVES